MIKITINKNKIINELEKWTPQYKETKRVSSEDKTALETVFQGKKRIVLELDIVPPSLANSRTKSEEISNYVVDNSYNYFLNYLKVKEPSNDPEREAKRRKLAQDPFVITTLKLIELAKDSYDKEEKLKSWMSEIMYKNLRTYNDNGITIDFATRRVSGSSQAKETNKSTYPLNKFIELHIKASKEMEDYFKSLKEEQRNEARWNIVKFRKQQNLPEVSESGQNFITLIERLTGNKFEDYAKSTMLFDFDIELALANSKQENYSVYLSEHLDLFKSLLEKFGYERLTNRVPKKMTMVLTRVPIEIVRMSDFPQLDSCHAVGGQYASCATQEAVSKGGAVAYLFQEIYNAGKKNRMETVEREFLKDPDRGIRGSNPITRMRLRTFKFAVRGDAKEKYLVIPSSKQYGRAYNSMFDTLKEFLLSKQSQVISELKDALTSQIVNIELLGGGYYQGSMHAEVEEFLGIDKTNKLFFGREYPSDYVPNVPSEDIVSEEYDNFIRNIIDNEYSDDQITFSVSSFVNVDGNEGYESGESEPNTYPDYEASTDVTYSLDNDDIVNNLADSIINRFFIDESRKDEVIKLINKNMEKMLDYLETDTPDLRLYGTFTSENSFSETNPSDAESEIRDDIQKMKDARDSLIDIENYHKNFQQIFINHFVEDSSITEARKIFKRFMRF